MSYDREIQILIDKKSIEELRYKYWFAIMDKDVARLLECFADDIKLEYGFGIELNNKQEIKEFFEALLGDDSLKVQVPRGANGMIELASEVSGTGRWLVEAITVSHDVSKATLASVQYFESYIKIDGEWKLTHMKNDYLYFEEVSVEG